MEMSSFLLKNISLNKCKYFLCLTLAKKKAELEDLHRMSAGPLPTGRHSYMPPEQHGSNDSCLNVC